MVRSARELVRTAVGLAAVMPALGLLVLAIVLIQRGGFGGALAGIFVAGIAVVLLAVALMMTHAPVSIRWMLKRTEREREARLALEDDHSSNGSEPQPRGRNSD